MTEEYSVTAPQRARIKDTGLTQACRLADVPSLHTVQPHKQSAPTETAALLYGIPLNAR